MGITSGGKKTVESLIKINEMYENQVLYVHISKSGDQVIKYYGLSNELETNFENIWVQIKANAPFLAVQIQLGKQISCSSTNHIQYHCQDFS